MAIIHGSAGSISYPTGGSFGTVNELCKNWVMNLTNDLIDITSLDDTTYKARIGGWNDWTVTADLIDADTNYTEANLFGALGGNATLQVDDGGIKYTGNAILVGVTKTLDANDMVTYSFSWQGSGAVTRAGV